MSWPHALRWAVRKGPKTHGFSLAVLFYLVTIADMRTAVGYDSQRNIAMAVMGKPLSEVTSRDTERVRKAVEVLIEMGLIEIVEKGFKGHATRYRVLWWAGTSFDPVAEEDHPQGAQSYEPGNGKRRGLEAHAEGALDGRAERAHSGDERDQGVERSGPADGTKGTTAVVAGTTRLSHPSKYHPFGTTTRAAVVAPQASESVPTGPGEEVHRSGRCERTLLDFDVPLRRSDTDSIGRGLRGGPADAARPNRYPEACVRCWERVEAGAGTTERNHTGKWQAVHLPGECAEWSAMELRWLSEGHALSGVRKLRTERLDREASERRRDAQAAAEDARRAALPPEQREQKIDVIESMRRALEEKEKRASERGAAAADTPGSV